MVAIKDMKMPSCCVNCDMCTCDNPTPKGENTGYCDITQNSIIDIYNERPSDCPLVEVEERKTGKWIIDDKEGNKIWHCHCSICKKDPQDYIGGSENWWLVRLLNYCPKCGAEMRGAENE